THAIRTGSSSKRASSRPRRFAPSSRSRRYATLWWPTWKTACRAGSTRAGAGPGEGREASVESLQGARCPPCYHAAMGFRQEVSVADAIRMVVAAAPSPQEERLPVATALGRVLLEDVVSLVDHPNADDSALDGYACRF